MNLQLHVTVVVNTSIKTKGNAARKIKYLYRRYTVLHMHISVKKWLECLPHNCEVWGTDNVISHVSSQFQLCLLVFIALSQPLPVLVSPFLVDFKSTILVLILVIENIILFV